jgi:hypothetical protein
LRGTATAEALKSIVELDLDALAATTPSGGWAETE